MSYTSCLLLYYTVFLLVIQTICYDAREKTDLYEKAGRVMDGLGLSVLDTFIPDSKRFRKECAEDGNKAVFRSTILPPDKQLIKGSNIEKLADEILSIIKK